MFVFISIASLKNVEEISIFTINDLERTKKNPFRYFVDKSIFFAKKYSQPTHLIDFFKFLFFQNFNIFSIFNQILVVFLSIPESLPQSNLTISNEPLPGIGSGIAKCPFDPEDNSTAIWVGKYSLFVFENV